MRYEKKHNEEPVMHRNLHLDFETYCEADLKKVGVYRYVEHPSFRVIAVAWKLEGGPTHHTARASGSPLPPELIALLNAPNIVIHAWNAAFEAAVLKKLWFKPAHPLVCTMQRALAYGLPAKLETAGRALGLKHQKDMAGHKLMLKMSKPQKPGAAPWTPEDYVALGRYCAKDVDSEEAISHNIPQLPPDEVELSLLDNEMNTAGGLCIDLPRVATLKIVAEDADKAEAARAAGLSGGMITSPGTQHFRVQVWLREAGLDLPNLERDTVDVALDDPGLSADVREMLGIRLRTARASTKKLQRMIDMAGPDNELQGQFQFCGAGRTGRWSGRGVQVQNLPRPGGFATETFVGTAAMAVDQGHVSELDAVCEAPVLDCVSWSLRSCLRARLQGSMWSFDFSQIEARVLAWLAGQSDVLEVFRSGTDIYIWAARQFGSDNRQLGKVLILALGYGMGAVKLRETARKSYRVVLTQDEANHFKDEWRKRNPKIVDFWYELDANVKQAILNRGVVYAMRNSGVAVQSTMKTLQIRLPSGRVLYYHKPLIDAGGEICYWGVELGQWSMQRTWGGKLAENVTQAIARDVMAEAMLRLRRYLQLVPLMSVHDELIYACEDIVRNDKDGKLEKLIREAPQWAGGLPLAGESKLMPRYGVIANMIPNI
jgi:DNA polymerase bacteriophage-type